MSAIVLVEQRPPFILTLASRVPTYTQIIISLLAVLLIQAFPSWAIAKPPVCKVTRKRRYSSLTSNATTLVDPDEVDAAKHTSADKEKQHHVSFSDKIPFKRFGSSVKMALSSSDFKPRIPRRLSLPARRLSSSVITALHHLTPHHRHHLDEKNDSYFSEEKVDSEMDNAADAQVVVVELSKNEASVVPTIVESVVQPEMQNQPIEGEMGQTVGASQVTPPKKRTTLKRVARRMSIILKFTSRA